MLCVTAGKAGPAAGPEDEWEELSAAETERVLAEAAKRDAAAAAASSGASAEDDEAPEWAKDAEPQHKRGRKSKASRQQPAAPEKDADDKKQASSVAAFGNRRLTDPNDVFSHNAWSGPRRAHGGRHRRERVMTMPAIPAGPWGRRRMLGTKSNGARSRRKLPTRSWRSIGPSKFPRSGPVRRAHPQGAAGCIALPHAGVRTLAQRWT